MKELRRFSLVLHRCRRLPELRREIEKNFSIPVRETTIPWGAKSSQLRHSFGFTCSIKSATMVSRKDSIAYGSSITPGAERTRFSSHLERTSIRKEHERRTEHNYSM